jgi:D-alanyl-lipoteichoic acid acyltransferase DltB (MBOAT superfamily)
VAFFPQLVAGPIERAEHLMDQLEKKDKKPQWKSGAQLILWGLFQKVVIADNVAVLANFAFNPSSGVLDTGVAIVGAYAFAIQIYCDFAGYTDIARGVAKWFGVDIMLNFNLPYFALCIRDFWARWHISLSTWLKDYLYIPLGGNRGSQTRTSINLMITMLLGGLWHGATWMFVLWGMYQGILLLIEHHLNIDPKRLRTQSLPMRILYGALTFQLVCFGWVLFRATNLDIFTHWITMFASMKFDPTYFALWGSLAFYSLPLLFVWIVQATKGLNDRLVYGLPTFARIAFTVILLAGLYFLSAEAGREFIYFQF